MTVVSNNMIITDDSLQQVSRKLINKGIYDGSKIEIVGHPSVFNGIASNLSETSYFTKSDLEITEDYEALTVNFEGTLSPNEHACAFKLGNLTLYFNEDTCSLEDQYSTVVSITNDSLSLGGQIQVSLLFTATEVTLKLILDSTFTLSETTEIQDKIVFPNPSTLLVGINAEGSNLYWTGSVDLSNLSIDLDGNLLYTPTTQPSITFTHIMIGDGKYPLNDNSVPILNHIYSFPIKELTRTNNNILITADIAEDAYLKISEMGLYCTFGNGTTHLFSILGGLSLNKSIDIGYNLVIRINLDINVVNTTIMPQIIIKEGEYPKLSDFETIKDTYAYSITNLERMIRTNALGIGSYVDQVMTDCKPVGVGYDKAQVYYRKQKKIGNWKDNFNAMLQYSYLKEKMSGIPIETSQFHREWVKTYGNVDIKDNGEAIISPFGSFEYDEFDEAVIGTSESFNINVLEETFDLPSSYYVEQETLFGEDTSRMEPALFTPNTFQEWDFTIAFRTPSSLTTESTIINYKSDSTQPLAFGLNRDFCNIVMYTQNGTAIYNGNLFQVSPSTNYIVKGSYSLGKYTFSYSTDGTTWTEAESFTSSDTIGEVEQIVIGAEYIPSQLSYAKGFFDLLYLDKFLFNFYDYSATGILTSTYTYKFVSTTLTYLENLKDFFHFPMNTYNMYKVNNIGDQSNLSKLQVLDTFFLGNEDEINFEQNNGFSLCLKVNLGDLSDKVILAKGDLETENFYFVLRIDEETKSLIFKYAVPDGTFTLSKTIDTDEIHSYIDNPILLSIICNGATSPTFTIMKNNEVIATGQSGYKSDLDITDYVLTNSLSTEDNINAKNVIEDILGIEGVISSKNLFYLNSLLNTIV